MILFHQSNRSRKAWVSGARGLAAAGHPHPDPRPPGLRRQRRERATDARAPGDRAGPRPVAGRHRAGWGSWSPGPRSTASGFGLGGAGSTGWERRAVARPSSRRGAVAGAGSRERPSSPGLRFLREACRPSGALRGGRRRRVPADGRGDGAAVPVPGQPGEGLAHYPGKKAPWLGYEPGDIGRCPPPEATGPTSSSGTPSCPARSSTGSSPR